MPRKWGGRVSGFKIVKAKEKGKFRKALKPGHDKFRPRIEGVTVPGVKVALRPGQNLDAKQMLRILKRQSRGDLKSREQRGNLRKR